MLSDGSIADPECVPSSLKNIVSAEPRQALRPSYHTAEPSSLQAHAATVNLIRFEFNPFGLHPLTEPRDEYGT